LRLPGPDDLAGARLHRIAVTQLRDYPPAKNYISRKLAEGKTKREAIRCLKAPPPPHHLQHHDRANPQHAATTAALT
jgi:hypothetical protein